MALQDLNAGEPENSPQKPAPSIDDSNFWDLLKLSLRGSEDINFTEGSIAKATVLLAIPMILEMAMESVFAIVDIFFVAGLGTEAVATVGLTEAMITLLYAVAIGLGMGTTAMVARRIGQKDVPGASFAAAQAIWLGIFISVLVGLIGLFFAEDILRVMGAEEAVVQTGKSYTRIMFGGSATIVFLFLINAIFRGAGDASIAMRALTLANVCNIVLDPCLIYGYGPFPEMGLVGAAVATNIGRGIGVAYALYYLWGGGGRIHLRLSDMVLQLGVIWSLIKISTGGIAQFLVATASWVFLMQLVSGFGADAVAGYTIGVRVVMFSILPAWGLSNAAATLVGQNLGAKLPERAESSVWHIVGFNCAYMATVTLLLFVFAEGIVSLFATGDGDVASYAVLSLRVLTTGFVAWGAGMAIVQAFNGAGDTMTPTYINVLCFWIIGIPLAYGLALSWEWGPVGVFWAVVSSDVLIAVFGYLVFRRGTWKLKEV